MFLTNDSNPDIPPTLAKLLIHLKSSLSFDNTSIPCLNNNIKTITNNKRLTIILLIAIPLTPRLREQLKEETKKISRQIFITN